MSDLEESHFEPDYEEDCLPDHIKGSTLGKKGKKCPVCSSRFTHVRRHVIQEHIPWFMYPRTSCWKCELGFGQERFLRLHLEKEHFDDSTDCRYDINLHGQRWIEEISIFLAKFDMVKTLSFINTNERFMSCQGAIWQEDDLEQILYYLNETKQHFPLTKMPYPAQNITSIFHWKILSILLDMNKIHTVYLKNNNLQKNKKILIVGSSFIYWAHQRSTMLNSSDLGLKNVQITWHGIRGMKWCSLVETVNSLTDNNSPDIMVIHLGSNDISFCSSLPLIKKMKTDISLFTEKFGNTILIFSEVLSRRFWGRIDGWEGEKKKIYINKEVGSFVEEKGGKVVGHNKIYWKNKSLFRGDGIHLSDKGNDILLEDFKECLGRLC